MESANSTISLDAGLQQGFFCAVGKLGKRSVDLITTQRSAVERDITGVVLNIQSFESLTRGGGFGLKRAGLAGGGIANLDFDNHNMYLL